MFKPLYSLTFVCFGLKIKIYLSKSAVHLQGVQTDSCSRMIQRCLYNRPQSDSHGFHRYTHRYLSRNGI